jgi:hypothetical protein
MAINFPDTAGQATDGTFTYTVAGITYAWNGSSWAAAGAGASATNRTLFSVTNAASGSSALSYNQNNGVFTYVPPDLSPYMTTSNGGAGSGYDADLLDGQEGSYYRNASNLNAGTVPSARLSGSYNISITGTAPAPNLDSLTNVTITNPQNSEVLQYNGSAWVNGASSITGLQSRASVSYTTSIAANGFVNAQVVTPKSYMLWRVEVSHACWLRLYCDTNSRSADQSRNIDSDPLPGSGVLAEVISSGQTDQLITPGTLCFNSGGSNTTYLRIDDRSNGTNNHTIILHYLQLEA